MKSPEFSPNKKPETNKNNIWKKMRNFIVAGSTLAMTTPGLAQKNKNKEKTIEPKIYTDLEEYKKAKRKYEDSLANYKWWKQQRELADSLQKENLWVGTPENGAVIDVNTSENFNKVASFYNKHPRLKKIADSNPPNNLTKSWKIGNTRYASYTDIFKKPTEIPVYKNPEIKNDTTIITQKPPEQRALENKNKDPLPVWENKNFYMEGSPVYGPNMHLIGFYTFRNNTFSPIPEGKEFDQHYGIHPEDREFLANTDSLKKFLRASLKMNNIIIKKPE